jgi:hypothetical protein
MATDRSSAVAPTPIAAASLSWPALRNGCPLVLPCAGTCLSQTIAHCAGWDRPVFHSYFLLPLHLTITTWPEIAPQALLRGALWPDASPWWLPPILLVLTVTLLAAVAVAGIAGLRLASLRCLPLRGLMAATLLALPVNAAVVGGLSVPHHRYQSRVKRLPSSVLLPARPNTRQV